MIILSNTVRLLSLTFVLLAAVAITATLILISKHYKKKYSKILDDLEREKNLILNANILSELNKVESMMNSREIENKYNEWKIRLEEIKNTDIPNLTDNLIKVEDSFKSKNYKEIEPILAKTELNIYHVKTKANYLLEEIRDLTLSEERNRETVTKLKGKYRQILKEYREQERIYSIIKNPIELQFENIDKLFSAFEFAMDEKSISEVSKIIKALDDAINNLEEVMEEAPDIILLGSKLIPKKIEDINNIYKNMTKDGYNLDYLSIEYNSEEARKKLADIFDRLNVLNLEDSILELKTISTYFDNIYNDYDKERLARSNFNDTGKLIASKANKLLKISSNLNKRMDEIRNNYDITDDDIGGLNVIEISLKGIEEDYNMLIEKASKKSSAFSKLNKEMEKLNVRLSKIEDNLDSILKVVNGYKLDEQRAHEQLDEIKRMLFNSKEKISSYKLPVIPKKYFVELSEATEAIKEMVKELEKKPLNIDILNTRVDTARDLTLKLYKTTSDTVKTASMSEHAIVYGNRYRASNEKVDMGLNKAEEAFYEGNYRKSLEIAINTLNVVEPGIHERLLEEFKN